MAVSSIKDFWIHPNALTITLNYFGDPQLIQTSMLAGAAIMAYRKDVISYDAAHNFREWKLQAFPTQLNDTCAYYVHAELSRSGDTAMIIYSPVKRDIEGRSYIDGSWNNTTSTESYFIYLGTLSASVDNNGATVERVWTDGFYTGTLDTDQQRMEEASGEWKTMFNYNAVTDQIEPLKPFSKIKVMGEAIFQSIAQFVNGLVIGKRTIIDVAASSDSGNESKVSDATLPTTGYVDKEIEALDDHFLIKDDPDADQSVAGPVTFEQDVTVQGDHDVNGNQTIEGTQEVGGLQTLGEGFQTKEFRHVAGQTNGAMLTSGGLFYASGLIANSFRINELIYNIVKAQGGKTVLSNAATVEKCQYKLNNAEDLVDEYDGDVANIDYVLLTIRSDEHNKGAMPFEEGDILYGNVNNIGESGQVAEGGECTMHVIAGATEDAPMTIKAKLYGVNGTIKPEEPSYYDYVSSNIPPAPLMTLAQRGNNVNTDRQSAIFLDGESGNIIMLQGISTPRLRKEYYATINGALPYDLYKEVQEVFVSLRANDPVIFGKYGIFENIIQYDHQGGFLQRERNRGVWSNATANSNVKDENGGYKERYKNVPSYYDTATHIGQLYKCLKSDTTQEPGKGSDWLLLVAKGDKGDYLVYDLTPSANIIYIREGNVPSVNSLEITVGESKPSGFTKITSQYELVKRNLKVQYAIDGVGARFDINIGSEDAIELEDETGVITDELDNGTLYLEGVEIPFASIKDNITLYLVDANGEDIVTSVIPVVHDGTDGDSPTTFHVEPSTISITLDANEESLPVVHGCDIQLKVSVKKGDTFIKPDGNWYGSYPEDGYVSIGNNDYDDSYEYPRIVIPKGTSSSDIPDVIVLPICEEATHKPIGETSITISKAQRGIVGRQGDAGPMPIMSGWYDPSFAYKLAYSSEGKLIGRPVVSVRNANGDSLRFSLMKDIPDDVYVDANGNAMSNGVDVGLSSNYWQAATAFSFLEAEILFAQFASFGGKNGGIFQDKFLFSQKGIKKDGSPSDWTKHVDGDSQMFDEKGDFSGEFTPTLFLNFLTGETKSNCFSEPFAQISNEVNIYQIDPTVAHNVSIQYGRTFEDGTSKPIMIFMPESKNVTDGANCTIVYQSCSMAGLLHEMSGLDQGDWGKTIANKLAVICADGRIPDMTSGYEDNTELSEGFFMVNGLPTRILFIAAGDVVKLKSVDIVGDKRVWVVENQSDFTLMQSEFQIDRNGTNLFYVTCNNSGSYTQSTLSSFASKQVMQFAKLQEEQSTKYKPLEYWVDLGNKTIEAK